MSSRAPTAEAAPRRTAKKATRRRRTLIRIKRAYDVAGADDGMRILVDRLWPRGVGKTTLAVALWPRAITPSTGLRKWYKHDPERFAEFRERYLSDPAHPGMFEGKAVVFDGPEDYHHRIDDPSLEIDEHTLLFMRGAGPIGYPGAAEVVNMRPPAYLIEKGVTSLACIGDGRQSGTSGSPSILNASPEAAAGGNLAILRTGDRVRIDLNKGEADILISADEIKKRRDDLASMGGYKYPAHQTPWQEIQRNIVDQLGDGAVLKPAVKYQRLAQTAGLPRDNH